MATITNLSEIDYLIYSTAYEHRLYEKNVYNNFKKIITRWSIEFADDDEDELECLGIYPFVLSDKLPDFIKNLIKEKNIDGIIFKRTKNKINCHVQRIIEEIVKDTKHCGCIGTIDGKILYEINDVKILKIFDDCESG